jgi:hypothetical protein
MPVNTETQTPSLNDDCRWTDAIYANESEPFKFAVRCMVQELDLNAIEIVANAKAVQRQAQYTIENVQANQMVLQTATNAVSVMEKSVDARKQLWKQFRQLLALVSSDATEVAHRDLVLLTIGEHIAQRVANA